MGKDLAQRVENHAQQVAQPSAPVSIGQLIQQLRPEMARALPRHMDADRMARIALTVLRTNPNLGLSTRESFMGALMTCAQLGLEPGAGGEAYLVPYKHNRGPLAGHVECQLIIGYQGLVKLFWQHPLAKHIDAQAVHERDEFDYAYGLDPFLRHKPALGERGKVIAYYGVASLTTGGSAFVVLSPEQVKALRQGREGPSGQIADPMAWMERKTVIRQLLKTLPKSANLVRAEVVDEKVRTDLSEDAIDLPAAHRQIEATATVPAGDAAGDQDGSSSEDPGEEPAPPASAPQTPRGGITQAQQKALHAVLHKAVGNDREAGLTLIAQELGLESLASTSDLTKAQGSKAIEKIQALLDARGGHPVPDPAAAAASWDTPPEDGAA